MKKLNYFVALSVFYVYEEIKREGKTHKDALVLSSIRFSFLMLLTVISIHMLFVLLSNKLCGWGLKLVFNSYFELSVISIVLGALYLLTYRFVSKINDFNNFCKKVKDGKNLKTTNFFSKNLHYFVFSFLLFSIFLSIAYSST
jgi:hypothetical protein